MRRIWTIAIGSVTGMAAPAAAQYQMVSPMLFEGPKIALDAHARSSRSSPDTSATPQADAVPPVSFAYKPSLERRRANYASFVRKTRAVDPAGAANLEQLFASRDVIAEMNAPLAKFGLRTDDVADAYAAYWINAWQATRGETGDVSTATLSAVRAQVSKSLTLASASDAIKQETAEALWIQSLMLSASVEQAQGKPEMLKAVADAAAQGAKALGLDVRSMTLTEQGFGPKG